ncbi:MAG: hypothetical protein JW850_21540 [Thermoflexales bacterium]|nr:hypothetical protein [Thermoflexales bacterium]
MNAEPSDQVIARWAERIKGLGWAAPALMPLMRAVGPLLSQVLWMGQPIASGLVDETEWRELALLLEHPDTLDKLEQQLESRR